MNILCHLKHHTKQQTLDNAGLAFSSNQSNYNKCMDILCDLKFHTEQQTLDSISNSFQNSYLVYCGILWFTLTNTDIDYSE